MSSIRKFNLEKREFQFGFNYCHYVWFAYFSSFFGSIIFKGNKLAAFNVLQRMRCRLKLIEGFDSYLVFLAGVLKLMPTILLRSMRQGVLSKGVPMEITERKQLVCVVQ
jgi:ribosomal protein S7